MLTGNVIFVDWFARMQLQLNVQKPTLGQTQDARYMRQVASVEYSNFDGLGWSQTGIE